MARQLILGTAGHIDHGKTALVRALTGVDTDRLPQEKLRGITIDIGFAHFDVGAHSIGIVDMPGHERFIKNMLAGASGIDLALLVVAADDSVMPQTREHLAILELLGIEHGVIALTKCDASEPSWVDLVEQDVRDLVQDTFLANAPIVRTSAKERTGLETLEQALAQAAGRLSESTDDEPFRLCVDRSFVASGLGTVVTGTVRSGRVCTGDDVAWLPRGDIVKVRSIQSHARAADEACRGQRAALNLPGIHHTAITRGDELATPNVFTPATRLAVRLKSLEDAPFAIKHRSRVRLHIGTGEVIASVRLRHADKLAPGDESIAELLCATPIIAMIGQAFVVRAESPLATLGGGTVLQVASKLRMREREAWNRVEHAAESPIAAIRARAEPIMESREVYQTCGLWGRQADDALRTMVQDGQLIELVEGRYLDSAALADISTSVLRVMARLHEAHPTDPHIERGRLAQEMPYLDEQVLNTAIANLINSERLVDRAGGITLPGRGPSFTPTQQRIHDAWIDTAKAAAYSPPAANDIADSCGVSIDEARKVARACVKLGELVHLADDHYLHADVERAMVERIDEALAHNGGLTVSQIKTMLDTSRKYAVPICEHLDRIGVTRRQGDVRVRAGRSRP